MDELAIPPADRTAEELECIGVELEDIPWFAALQPREREEVSREATLQLQPQGARIESSDGFLCLLEGRVQARNEAGNVIFELKRGDGIGLTEWPAELGAIELRAAAEGACTMLQLEAPPCRRLRLAAHFLLQPVLFARLAESSSRMRIAADSPVLLLLTMMLRRVRAFEPLPPAAIAPLAEAVTLRRLSYGTPVYLEGDARADALCRRAPRKSPRRPPRVALPRPPQPPRPPPPLLSSTPPHTRSRRYVVLDGRVGLCRHTMSNRWRRASTSVLARLANSRKVRAARRRHMRLRTPRPGTGAGRRMRRTRRPRLLTAVGPRQDSRCGAAPQTAHRPLSATARAHCPAPALAPAHARGCGVAAVVVVASRRRRRWRSRPRAAAAVLAAVLAVALAPSRRL